MAKEQNFRGNNNGNKSQKYVAPKGDITKIITESLNKHGEIKGNGKKDTKNKKAICNHHRYNKKGKVKPMIWNDGAGKATCDACGHSFPTSLYGKDKTHKITKEFVTMLDQKRYLAQAADLGEDVKYYLATLSLNASHFEKVSNNIERVVAKQEQAKHKKKKSGNRDYGRENLGGWR